MTNLGLGTGITNVRRSLFFLRLQGARRVLLVRRRVVRLRALLMLTVGGLSFFGNGLVTDRGCSICLLAGFSSVGVFGRVVILCVCNAVSSYGVYGIDEGGTYEALVHGVGNCLRRDLGAFIVTQRGWLRVCLLL